MACTMSTAKLRIRNQTMKGAHASEKSLSTMVAHLFFYGASDDKQKIGCKHPTKMPMIKRDAEKGTEELLKYVVEGWMSNCLSNHVTFTNFILSIV